MTPATGNWSFVIAAFAIAWLGIGGYWLYASGKVHEARSRYARAAEHRGSAR